MERRAELARLFREAGSAHHRAFVATGGDDPDWPFWYSRWLQPRLQSALGADFNLHLLAALLKMLEDQRKSRAPHTDWPNYYADFFLTAQS